MLFLEIEEIEEHFPMRRTLPLSLVLALFPLLFFPTSFLLAATSVVDVTPPPQSMSAGTMTEVTVAFDSAMDASTIHGGTIMVLGRWSGIAPGTFTLENGGTLVRFIPTEPFSAGEWVTVAVSNLVRSASGDSMAFGYAWSFWIAAGPGTLDLTEIDRISVREPGEPHIQTYGAHAADLNEDGYTDITLPNELSDDIRVFLNDGLGGYDTFVIHPIPDGNFASTNEAADLNGDGHMDIVVGNGGNDRMCVFIGDGTGGFTSATSYQAGSSVRGVAAMDLDGDGDADVVTANRSASNLSIFKNNGDGTFQPRQTMEGNGSQETACGAVDANKDGILDLFVGALGSQEMILLLGDGAGGLVVSSEVDAGGAPWMVAVGDVNGDGNVDVVSANSFNNNAAVILGDGMGGMLPAVNYPVGNFALAIDLGDIDGDGDLDMVTSNYGSASWTLYENDGSGTFINPRTLLATSAGSCATLHDRDNDGDLDMTGIDEIVDLIFIFDNDLPLTVAENDPLPAGIELQQNYPNPFNPSTAIPFRVPVGTRIAVSLQVFDVLGREVATLVRDELASGTYRRVFNAEGLASGVYFYRLTAGGSSLTRKLILSK